MEVKWEKYTINRLEDDVVIYKDGKFEDEGYLVLVATIPCEVLKQVMEDK